MDWLRLREWDFNPTHWVRNALQTTWKALLRLWGRDVMLYVGGVSFFALLAVFPILVIVIGLYGLFATAATAETQAEAFARLMPAAARAMFEGELVRLVHAPRPAMSLQSVFALVIGGYAAHRGFKAMLAGLQFIHGEDKPRGFLSFNFIALLVALAAFGITGVISTIFLGFRLFAQTLDIAPLRGLSWIYSDWTWTSVGMTLGLTLIYRYAMSREPVIWRASILGGVAASVLFLAMSWASAIYVEQIVQLGATYGSVATVVVLLIWLSWNVNAVFFGGALATEVEIALHAYHAATPLPDAPLEGSVSPFEP